MDERNDSQIGVRLPCGLPRGGLHAVHFQKAGVLFDKRK